MRRYGKETAEHLKEAAFRSSILQPAPKPVRPWGWSGVLPVWFRCGVYSRRDNADFVESRFSNSGLYGEAAVLLREASEKYGEIMDILNNPEYTSEDYQTIIPGLLKEIAKTETKLSKTISKIK